MSNLKSQLQLEKNKDLFPYLTIKVHVKAEFFFEAKTKEDLIRAKEYSLQNNIPLFILGGGSNLVPLRDKIFGLVVLNRYIKKQILRKEKNFVDILISSGYPVAKLVSETIEKGWEGFEYHKGLPGTVGGAIYMNSKWTRPLNYFSQNLLYAYLLDEKAKIKKVNQQYFQFAYDFSILQKTKEILLEGIFRLNKSDFNILRKRSEEVLSYRKKTQPFGVASSGCFFKNINGISAGYLIDKSGLKGFSVGDWVVSNIHANFILNKGGGKLEDLARLIEIIKQKVKDKFGVNLKEEVIRI